MSDEDWRLWASSRPVPRVRHLDTAAAGRSSYATLEAVAAHSRLEAEVGAYVAQEQAADVVDGLRRDLAVLVGLEADGVALVESASAARTALLRAWGLPEGARIGTLAGEWGPNLEAFRHEGLTPVRLASDGAGVVDLDALSRRLEEDPPDVVHLTHAAAHRALVQPVADVVALCRAAGVPVWVDAAQSLGQLDTAGGADAVYATGRKWLCGPRGVGMLAVARAHWDDLRLPRPAKLPDLPPVRYAESDEAHVAGRVGLAVAVRDLLDLGVDRVGARLTEVGDLTRAVLADVPGWELLDAAPAAGAITSLRAAAGQDVVRVRARLLDVHRILTTANLPWRAPDEMGEPYLRVSPHVDATAEDLLVLRSALAEV